MTQILYCKDLDEYIRIIIRQEMLGQYPNAQIKLQPTKKPVGRPKKYTGYTKYTKIPKQ